MIQCKEKNENGLYLKYVYSFFVKNTYVWFVCESLEDIKRICKYYRKKYPNGMFRVHRFQTVCDINTQMKKEKEAELTAMLSKYKTFIENVEKGEM